MRILFFCHSVVSDWNHGNAHFLRGICTELQRRGHDVQILEPAKGWSLQNMIKEQGAEPVRKLRSVFQRCIRYFTIRRHRSLTVCWTRPTWSSSTNGTNRLLWRRLASIMRGTAFYDIDTPVTLSRIRDSNCD